MSGFSKNRWQKWSLLKLSVVLDGIVDGEKIKFPVDMSYELTKKRGSE